MPVTLSSGPIQDGTFAITATFTDETGATVVPNAVTWTLVNDDGKVQNSRSAVSVTAATSITVILSGSDLSLLSRDSCRRVLLFDGTYDSSNGSGLPLKESVYFTVTRRPRAYS